MSKACVFVDGENFRHIILALFEREMAVASDYLPRNANWAEFFDMIVDLASEQPSSRLRTYWYVVRHIDVFPYRLPNTEREADTFDRVVSNDEEYREELASADVEDLPDARRRIFYELRNAETNIKRKFEGYEIVQDAVARQRAIEFRRSGSIRYDLFREEFHDEKGVDVQLAVDMVTMIDNYDIAVLISGDQDYTPAVQAIKDSGKTVVTVHFQDPSGRVHAGNSRRLQVAADATITLDYEVIKEYLFPDAGNGAQPRE